MLKKRWIRIGAVVAALVMAVAGIVYAATDLTAFTGTLRNTFTYNATIAGDIDNAVEQQTHTLSETLAFGTGNSKCNQIWVDRRLVVKSATDQLDLSGSLKNTFGHTILFTKVHILIIHNRSDETLTKGVHGVDHTITASALTAGGPAGGSQFILFSDKTDTYTFSAGDWMVVWSKAGRTVTAGTGDLFDIVETGTAEAAYDILIAGEE